MVRINVSFRVLATPARMAGPKLWNGRMGKPKWCGPLPQAAPPNVFIRGARGSPLLYSTALNYLEEKNCEEWRMRMEI